MNAKRPRLLRWLFLALVTAVAGWVLYLVSGVLVALAVGGSAGLLRMLLGAYAALASGFIFCALLTRVAPSRTYAVAVGLVFVVVIVAAALMLNNRWDAGPTATVLVGISLVVGAFGYALRLRGFSETMSGRDGMGPLL